jgi:hypothetical protein
MSLTRDFWEKVIVGVGVAVLTVVLNIGVREWYQPDIRYERGGAYISPTLAISTLRMQNMGRTTAENVIITASFADSLTAIATGKTTSPFELSDGGVGQKSVKGTIKRIVPGETVTVYFLTEPSSAWSNYSEFIREIKSNEGLGKTGRPILRFWVVPYLVSAVLFFPLWIGLYYLMQRHRRVFDTYSSEAIQKGYSAAEEGASEEQLRARVDEWRRTMPFYSRPPQETLMMCAQTAFTGVKQSPT